MMLRGSANVGPTLRESIATSVKITISTIQNANVSFSALVFRICLSSNSIVDCKCDLFGTEEEVCDKVTGSCLCKEGYGGPRCDQCLPRFYNFPNCTSCNCSGSGSVQPICDQTGKCQCFSNYAGKQCTVCAPGFYQYPECLQCGCDPHGARGN